MSVRKRPMREEYTTIIDVAGDTGLVYALLHQQFIAHMEKGGDTFYFYADEGTTWEIKNG